jgi:hypothetical protein
MKTKTRDLSTCLKRRLWIVGVCLTTFSFLSVSVAYAVSDNQTVQQQKKGLKVRFWVQTVSLLSVHLYW